MRRRGLGVAVITIQVEAVTVFSDPISANFPDPDHSDDEDRLIIIGYSDHRRLLIVSYTGGE